MLEFELGAQYRNYRCIGGGGEEEELGLNKGDNLIKKKRKKKEGESNLADSFFCFKFPGPMWQCDITT